MEGEGECARGGGRRRLEDGRGTEVDGGRGWERTKLESLTKQSALK